MNLKSSAPNRPHEISFFISLLVAARGPSALSAEITSFPNASVLKSNEDGEVFSRSG